MVTHGALHRSQRARLAHWAPPLGHTAQALLGIGLEDMRRRNEERHPPPEPLVELALRAVALRATLKTTPPQPDNGMAERVQRRTVARHAIVPVVPGDHAAQVGSHGIGGVMQPLTELAFQLLQLAPHALLLRLPKHDELPLPRLVATMREAKEIEGLRLPPRRAVAESRPQSGRTR